MKKLLLTLIGIALFSTAIAQDQPWNPVTNGQNSMVLKGVISIDNAVPQTQSTNLEVGAFCNGECRAAEYAGMFPVPGMQVDYWVNMTINGTTGDIITFRLYDHESGLYYESDCSIVLEHLANIGSPGNWYQLLFYTPSGPQPTTYTLDITGYGSNENPGGYYLISSPVTENIAPSTDNGFLTGEYDLYYFDQAGDNPGNELNNEWINYEAGLFEIVSGKGYLYASKSGTTLQFTGTAYSDDGVIDLEYYTSNLDNRMHGWNLIGNPFPQDATINRACYVMNTNGTELASAALGTLIPAMNGVFVKAEDEGESVTFTPSTSGSGTEVAKVVLNVLRDRAATLDRAIVCFDENSTLPKFMLDSNNTKVYIPESGEQFAVVSSARQNSLPVNFKAKENGTYTLSVDINNIEMEYLHLIDNMTGADIDLLQQPSYQFNASTSDFESRFMLVFRAETGVQEQGQESFCFVNGRSLYFCEDVEGATFNLVDMTGRMVRNESLKGNGVSLDNLSEGVYVVRLAKGNDVKTQKVVVR